MSPLNRTALSRNSRCASHVLAMAGVLCACSDSGSAGRADGAADTQPRAATGKVLPAARAVSFIKLEQVSELNGQAWASVAELTLLDSTGTNVERTGWRATADSAAPNDVPANAIDGNPRTLWHTPWDGEAPPPPHALVIALGASIKVSGFSYLPRQDAIRNGTIGKYRFFISADGVDWGVPVSEGDFGALGPPTLEKTIFFARQTPNQAPVVSALPAQTTWLGQEISLRVVASDGDGDPLLFEAVGLPAGIGISPKTGLVSGTPISPGSHTTTVTVKDNKGAAGSTALQWVVKTDSPGRTAMPAAKPGQVRFVKLEEVSEINGKAWGAVAEFNVVDSNGVNLLRTGWTARADSADINDRASHAIDGNPASIWHTQWDGLSPPPPHSLIIDMGAAVAVHGFRYLPRQDTSSNGTIAKFSFYTSQDGVTWGAPVAQGDFSQMGKERAEKTVMLK